MGVLGYPCCYLFGSLYFKNANERSKFKKEGWMEAVR